MRMPEMAHHCLKAIRRVILTNGSHSGTERRPSTLSDPGTYLRPGRVYLQQMLIVLTHL